MWCLQGGCFGPDELHGRKVKSEREVGKRSEMLSEIQKAALTPSDVKDVKETTVSEERFCTSCCPQTNPGAENHCQTSQAIKNPGNRKKSPGNKEEDFDECF